MELRLKIWRSTFPKLRIVGIESVFDHSSRRFRGWKSVDPSPIVLRISHESREEALKHYQLSFGTEQEPPCIYFNFEMDTLRFGNGPGPSFLTMPTPSWLESGPQNYLLNIFLGRHYSIENSNFHPAATHSHMVRHMIVDIENLIYGRRAFCWDEIRNFDSLKELILVAWDEDEKSEKLMGRFQIALNKVSTNHPRWVVPKIKVVSGISGTNWGNLIPKPVDEFDS